MWHFGNSPQRRIGSVGQGGTTPVDPDGDAADQVTHADGQAGPEQRVAGVVGLARVEGGAVDGIDLGREDDGHDDAVDGHHLAENDGYQILGPDPRRPDAASQDGRAGDEDAPGKWQSLAPPRGSAWVGEPGDGLPRCADDGQAYA